MLAGPHIATGAMIGRVSRRAWLALPLAFASHYALDVLPHSYLSLREPGAMPLRVAIVAADAAVGLALVAWIARRQPHWKMILGSAFAATLLDLMNPVTPVGIWLGHAPGTAWLIHLHMICAYHVPFGRQWLPAFGPSAGILALAALSMWLSNAHSKAPA
jgi:hypothetical protein